MREEGLEEGFSTPFPVFEWDEAEAWSGILNIADERRFGGVNVKLYECELAYRTARFEEALRQSEELMQSTQDTAVLTSAQCTHFMTCLATGDVEGAYKDLRELYALCSEGMKSDDRFLRGTSILCAMRVEDALMAKIFDLPTMEDGIDDVPGGLKAYMGYLIALREIRDFNFARASGIAFTFRKVMGPHYSMSRIGFMLITASCAMVEHDLETAERAFTQAWKYSGENGLIMPFVEINFILFGLRRRCLDVVGEMQSKKMDKLIGSYRDGWFGLRKKCGLSTFGYNLTVLEMSVASLAAMGWRNKEIAAHLNIAETTVKHQLTSVFQKLGATKRTELQMFNEPGIYEQVLSL